MLSQRTRRLRPPTLPSADATEQGEMLDPDGEEIRTQAGDSSEDSAATVDIMQDALDQYMGGRIVDLHVYQPEFPILLREALQWATQMEDGEAFLRHVLQTQGGTALRDGADVPPLFHEGVPPNLRIDGRDRWVQEGLPGAPITWIGGIGGRNTRTAEEGDLVELNPREMAQLVPGTGRHHVSPPGDPQITVVDLVEPFLNDDEKERMAEYFRVQDETSGGEPPPTEMQPEADVEAEATEVPAEVEMQLEAPVEAEAPSESPGGEAPGQGEVHAPPMLTAVSTPGQQMPKGVPAKAPPKAPSKAPPETLRQEPRLDGQRDASVGSQPDAAQEAESSDHAAQEAEASD